jgi:HSP90 family molecular chaperone
MLPKELLQSFNLTGEKDLKTAENIWRMLDEMA